MSNGSTKNLNKSTNFVPISQFSCFLVDNGSLRPAPTLNLRIVANQLGGQLGIPVHPVSLLHSSKVDLAKLGGVQANLLNESLKLSLRFPEPNHILILPMFFGPSRAITEYIPQVVDQIKGEGGSVDIRIANCLVQRDDDSAKLIAQALLERIQQVATNIPASESIPQVVLVDHGSAVKGVLQAREFVSNELENLLEDDFSYAGQCSMENPKGAEKYSNLLLEELLASFSLDTPVILSQMFFANGRHAGADGDIATICRASGHEKVFQTEPLLEHSLLVELLKRRALEAIA